ncbi:hypothetical protein Taro_053827 [Colocasia esculenta]|uniref:Uncharacterized protein n=1 Tax=Colocasia esculenta TaxID=4460 RepID=A0A843XM93_COLES|nr:hypothetical protein [Colocasia esculenta]
MAPSHTINTPPRQICFAQPLPASIASAHQEPPQHCASAISCTAQNRHRTADIAPEPLGPGAQPALLHPDPAARAVHRLAPDAPSRAPLCTPKPPCPASSSSLSIAQTALAPASSEPNRMKETNKEMLVVAREMREVACIGGILKQFINGNGWVIKIFIYLKSLSI